MFFPTRNDPQSVLLTVMRGVYMICLLSYLYTAMCNPGIVVKSEDNSVENQERLESQEYTYCSICDLYRPPKANHCSVCGVCYEG